MHKNTFAVFVSQVGTLTRCQRARLIQLLLPNVKRDQTVDLIEQAKSAPRLCPDCGASHTYRHGRVDGMQRYRCRACGRTWNALTNTPLARLQRKECWLEYLDGMLDARSIRRAAATAGVATATSFRWRHRFLELTKHDRAERLSGIAEADEMYLLESQKGSRKLDRPARQRGGKATQRGLSMQQMCILVARDRSGQTLDYVPCKGPVTAAALHTHLEKKLAPDVLLVTDSHAAYRAFARRAGIQHEAVNLQAGIRVRAALHVQNVNAYHSRLRGWLLPFRGVASRYLTNYLGWRWAVDGRRIDSAGGLLRAALGISPADIFNT